MIMKIFKLRTASKGPMETVSYILGITDRKTMAQSESCQFLINNNSLIPFNICPDDPDPDQIAMLARTTADDMVEMASRNQRVKKPFWHAMISLPPEDSGRLNNNDWIEIVDSVMGKLGFASCIYIAAVHRDTDAEHVHISACTVQDELRYPVVKRLNDYQIAEDAMREIEARYGLTKVAPSSESGMIDSPTRNTLKQEMRDTLDVLIEEALATPRATLLTLYKLAEKERLTINIQWKNGSPTGISYGHAGFTTPGSKLAAKGRYAMKGLLNAGFLVPTGHDLIELEAKTAPVGKPKKLPSGEIAPPTREAAFCDYSLSVRVPTAAANLLKKKAPAVVPQQTEQPHATWERWYFLVRIRTWGKKKIVDALGFLSKVTKALSAHLEELLEMLNHPTSITPEPPEVASTTDIPPVPIHDGPKTSPAKQAQNVLTRQQEGRPLAKVEVEAEAEAEDDISMDDPTFDI